MLRRESIGLRWMPGAPTGEATGGQTVGRATRGPGSFALAMLLLSAPALAVGVTPGTIGAGHHAPCRRCPRRRSGPSDSGSGGRLGPDLGPGRALPLRQPRAGSSSSTASTPSTSTRPTSSIPTRGSRGTSRAADASLMARLGFNVVRLGMTWSGLEPGTAPANDPAICSRGTPTNPHQFNQAVFDRYVTPAEDDGRPARPVPHLHDPRHAPGRVQRDVRRRGRTELGGVHQRRAERRPARAAGPSSTPPRPPASPSATSGTTTSGATCRASTTRSGATWPRAFSGNPWVLGYDPFNEPFSTSLIRFGDAHFDAQLECFYTGTAPHRRAVARRAAARGARPTTRPTASCRPSWPTTPPI